MKAPTLHLNGTPAEQILPAFEEAGHALRVALEAIGGTYPNARDFYVQQESGAFVQAQNEHQDRCDRLRSILAELEEIHENVAEQNDAREARKANLRASRSA